MPDLTISTPVDNLVACADAAAMRTVLGLGTAAVYSAGDFEAAGGIATHAALTSSVHGITATGATLTTAASVSAARTALGLGTAATSTLATLLSDLGYTAATRVLASASTGASATLTLADGTNPGLMASADYTKLNTITTKRVVGRNTAGSGASEEVTADQLLDWIGTAASGDILYRGASTHSRLTIGSANAILNSSGTAPQYSSLGTLLDTIGSAANGDLLYRSGSATYSRLAIGASGRILTSSGTAPQYSTITAVLDQVAGTPTGGDIIYRDVSAYARLAGPGVDGLLYYNSGAGVPVWSTKWTLNSSGTLTGATGSLGGSSTPAIAITQTWSNVATTFKAFTITITDTNSAADSLPFQILSGSTNLLSVDKSGVLAIGASSDVLLQRDAANQLALRNGTNAESLAVYTTYTSSSNFERLRIYGTAASNFTIAAERDATPTGSYRGIDIKVVGRNAVSIAASGTSAPITISTNYGGGLTLDSTTPLTAQGGVSVSGGNMSMFAGYGVQLRANGDFAAGSGSKVAWASTSDGGATLDTGLKRSAAAIVGVTDGSTGGGAIELQEMSAPAAGSTNFARIYAEDNGSGKTRIVVRFPTGAAQVLATEP